jgi:hypothetical protein
LDPESAKAESESIPILPGSPTASKRPLSARDPVSLQYFSTPIAAAKTVYQSPDTELSILSGLSSPKMGADPASHDKAYYDDRCNDSVFDPHLALAALPRIAVSIGGMLLTGYILNIIIVSFSENRKYFFKLFLDLGRVQRSSRVVHSNSCFAKFTRNFGAKLNWTALQCHNFRSHGQFDWTTKNLAGKFELVHVSVDYCWIVGWFDGGLSRFPLR